MIKAFRTVHSIVTPLEKVNVDTDQIVPKQFLKLVQRSGFGRFVFYDWRYQDGDEGLPRTDFVLNDSQYTGSKILVAGDNFGCGSSREHAVWALADYGFEVVIAPSFADIFFSNCFKNGVLPITLAREQITYLQGCKTPIEIDLDKQTIRTQTQTIHFQIEAHRKHALLEGLDDIAQTLKLEKQISAYEDTVKIPSLR